MAKVQYRVYYPNESLRKSIRAKKELNGVNVKAVLDGAVSDSLPRIVAALQAVGFRMAKGKRRAARWPVDDELLGALRVASKQTGIPANKLLTVSLALFCQKGTN
jgi:hypothetical protein